MRLPMMCSPEGMTIVSGDGRPIVAAVDSSVLLSILLCDPAEQAEAGYRFLERCASEGRYLRLYPWAVAEIVFVLERKYKVDRPTIAADVASLIGHRALAVDAGTFVLEALALYGRHNVPFGEALIAMSTRNEGATEVHSRDPHFGRIPGARPAEARLTRGVAGAFARCGDRGVCHGG